MSPERLFQQMIQRPTEKHQAKLREFLESWGTEWSKLEETRIPQELQSANLDPWELTETGPPAREHAGTGSRPSTHL